MLPSFFKLYQKLIATPSISSTDPTWDQSNTEVISLLGTWFEDLGFKITLQSLTHYPGKSNLIAQLGEGDGGLMLAGHTDTVPFDHNRWQSDPFTLCEKDNRWYGLGTIDMKGFFAFVLDIARELKGIQLKKPLYIVATADEETTMAGARHLAIQAQHYGLEGLKPELCVIGEPTELTPVFAHKGHLSLRLTLKGHSGHSSQPALGLNTIELLYQALEQLTRLQRQLQQDYLAPIFDVPYPTLNFGQVSGGDSPNRICGQCQLTFDLRPTPNIPLAQLMTLIESAIAPIQAQYPRAPTLTHLHDPIPAFESHNESTAIKTLEALSNHKACSVNYCTEAPFLQQLGCETLIFGPGSIKQAHQPNEYLNLDTVAATRKALRAFIHQHCIEEVG